MRPEEVSFDKPLFDEIGKYPVQFSTPVFFGESPLESHAAALKNATGTLIKLGSRYIGVTCAHVLAEYRRNREQKKTFFQFGPIVLSPDAALVGESHRYDAAVFDLTPFVDTHPELTRKRFVEPTKWPPATVSTEDVICLGGFPGIWREQISLGHLRFYAFSSGAGQVHSVGEHHLMTRVEIERCIVQINHGVVLGSLGGLSGGPVFAWRRGPILTAELVGFVQEYEANFDLMRVTTMNVVRSDGTLIS